MSGLHTVVTVYVPVKKEYYFYSVKYIISLCGKELLFMLKVTLYIKMRKKKGVLFKTQSDKNKTLFWVTK